VLGRVTEAVNHHVRTACEDFSQLSRVVTVRTNESDAAVVKRRREPFNTTACANHIPPST
jgi:hypothetical protein